MEEHSNSSRRFCFCSKQHSVQPQQPSFQHLLETWRQEVLVPNPHSSLSFQLHGYMESEPLTLQLFIGTADDRLLRPHAFYQVHRITGKTVSTPSHEVLHNNTKVLEIPLLPENDMRAM